MVAGADTKLVDSKQRSVLHLAVAGGHRRLVGDLLIGQADVNAATGNGDTPLHLAAAGGKKRIACMLVRRGASTVNANTKGQRPLHVAVSHGHLTVAEVLLEAGADPNFRYGVQMRYSPLYFARGNSALTSVLLRGGANVSESDDLGYTALHWAGAEGVPRVIEKLVDAGSDLRARSSVVSYHRSKYIFSGVTPLHVAALARRLENITALLDNGSSINEKGNDGWTPLHLVCKTSTTEEKSAKIADLLLRWGADETATDNDGRTPQDLIDGGKDEDRRLRQVLANAPADRSWRRRGVLVMCRIHADKKLSKDSTGRAEKVLRQGKESRPGPAARCNVLWWVVEQEVDSIFRTLVEFL